MDRWDASAFRLIADNDLTYHHCVEVTFTDVVWVSVADLFHHPVFRPPTATEREFARQVIDASGISQGRRTGRLVAAACPK